MKNKIGNVVLLWCADAEAAGYATNILKKKKKKKRISLAEMHVKGQFHIQLPEA